MDAQAMADRNRGQAQPQAAANLHFEPHHAIGRKRVGQARFVLDLPAT